MSFTHKFKSTIFIITIFINDILSFPFEFPKSGISFSSSDETDEYKDIRRCLNEEEYSMPFFDPQTNEFPCHKLLTQGPCNEDQLFVLDEEIRFSNNKELPTTKCIDRECYPKPEYKNNSTELLGWRETVMFNGNCTEVRSSAECEGDNMVVLVNPFGKGECGCKDKFIEWNPKDDVDFSDDRKCYQAYLQGPCDLGYQLIPKEDIELSVKVNNRTLETPVWFSLDDNQVTRKGNSQNDFGSMCIPSDCAKEGYVRLKSGKCIKPAKCQSHETLIFSTEFSNGNVEESNVTCCIDDDEIHFRRYIFSDHPDDGFSEYEKSVKEVLEKDACADYIKNRNAFAFIRSALVTIPESCPKGQTITHDGECKHVRIWRSRPRRSSNSASRIRQMMRYVRALKRQRPGLE